MNNDNENLNTNGVPTPPPPPVNEDLNNLPPAQPQVQADINTANYTTPQPVDNGVNSVNSANIPPQPNPQYQQYQQTTTPTVPTYSDNPVSISTEDSSTKKKKWFIIGLIAVLVLAAILIPLIIFLVNRNADQAVPEEVIVEQTMNEINLDEQEGDLQITEAGNYMLSGSLDGAVLIDAQDAVSLNLNSAQISSTNGPAINNQGTNDLNIAMADNSENTIIASPGEGSESPSAAIYSVGNISIDGTGQLTVTAKDLDGIVSENNIVINNGDLAVYSDKNALVAGNTAEINGGNITLEGKDYSIKTSAGYTLNGGRLVALSVNNIEAPSSDSLQQSIVVDFDKPMVAEELISVVDKNGQASISFKAKSDFDKAVVSASELSSGEYKFYQGGNTSGTSNNGRVYSSGTVSGASPITVKGSEKFTVSSASVTEVNNNLVVEEVEAEVVPATSTNNNNNNNNSTTKPTEPAGSGVNIRTQ